MYFRHSAVIWRDFPELVPLVISVEGITPAPLVADRVNRYLRIAESRLAAGHESEFPEVQAWRRAFSRMGLKPTQYRCASESLLRRFRKEKTLPQIHPFIDLCNAISCAFGIPIAAFDVARINGFVEVRHAAGNEDYITFAGTVEHPDPDEIVFVDSAGRAHARRWTNRQSGQSAVQDDTRNVLIVAEAMHDSAPSDIEKLATAIEDELRAIWSSFPRRVVLTKRSPQFDF